MFIYHEYDGKMVVDEAAHTAEWRAHYQGDPKFKNNPIAGLDQPMDEKTLKRYEEFYELKHDPAKRPPMKPFSVATPAPRKPFATRVAREGRNR
jgi:hypothetical protein